MRSIWDRSTTVRITPPAVSEPLPQRRVHRVDRCRLAGPALERLDALEEEHPRAVDGRRSRGGGIGQEPCLDGRVDGVEYRQIAVERVGRHRRRVLVHPDAGAVDQHVGVGQQAVEVLEAVAGRVGDGVGQFVGGLDGPVGDPDRHPFVGQPEGDGTTRTASTDDDGRPLDGDVVLVQGADRADGVGVVPARLVAGQIDRVDRADALGKGVRFDRVQYVLLERDGDVEAVDPERLGRLDGGRRGVFRRFEGDVAGVQTESFVGRLVHRRRQRVFDRVPDQTEDVHTPMGSPGGYERHAPGGNTPFRTPTTTAVSQAFRPDLSSTSVVSRLRHPLVQIGVTVLLTVPWTLLFTYNTLVSLELLSGAAIHLGTLPEVALTGVAVLGASFLLAWGAETAEKDVPRAFAIAVLAVLAVAPEYAVDALYAWNAGAGGATAEACSELTAAQIEAQATPIAEACHNANLAVANMTGANRILIGIGWAGIALFTVWRAFDTKDPAVQDREGWLGDAVQLDRDIATEITFLFAATMWAFLVPLGGGIDAIDTIVLVGIYVAYIALILKSDIEHEEEQVGVPEYLQSWSLPWRPVAVLTLFGYSGVMIFTAVEPFAHGLEQIGLNNGIPEFFMIQWIAPLASESPELIVVAVLVNKARSTAGFNALISSKLNQWTLLIGTLAVVFSLSFGTYGVLPFDDKQAAEIWITAAQSYFALALLCNFEISVRESLVLFGLFISQVVVEFALIREWVAVPIDSYELLLAYTALYLVAGTVLLIQRRRSLKLLFGLAADAARDALGRETVHGEFTD